MHRRSIAFSPDGNLLAWLDVTDDGSHHYLIRLWDFAEQHERVAIVIEDLNTYDFLFNQDGSQIVSDGLNGAIHIWDTNTGQEIRGWQALDVVDRIALSPDGLLLATSGCADRGNQGCASSVVKLWNVESGTEYAAWTLTKSDYRYNLAISPDGRWLLANDDEEMLIVWNIAERREEVRFSVTWYSQSTFSPDSQLAFLDDGKLWLHNFDTRYRRSISQVWSCDFMAFSPDGTTLAAPQGEAYKLVIWNLVDNTSKEMPGSPGVCTGYVLNSTFTRLAVAYADMLNLNGHVQVWDVTTGQVLLALENQWATITSVGFNPDSSLLAFQSLIIWHIRTGETERLARDSVVPSWTFPVLGWVVDSTEALQATPFCTEPHPERFEVCLGSEITVKERDTQRVKSILKGHGDWITDIAFSQDGRLLASCSRDNTIRLWDVETGRELWRQSMYARRIAFSPDGSLVAASGSGVGLWKVADGQRRILLPPQIEAFWALRFSPDGTLLAAGGWDGTVHLWDLNIGSERAVFDTGEQQIWDLAFSPDGAVLAFAGADRKVRLGDTTSGTILAVLKGHTDSINSITFSPDGTLLASGSDDGTVRLWGLPF